MPSAHSVASADARQPASAAAGQARIRARGIEDIASEPDAVSVFQQLVRVRRPRPETSQHFIAARTESERRIAAVWCAVLGLETVGVDDRFADLGGRSLDLVEVYCGLSAGDRGHIAFTDLFRFTTVGALAARLAQSPTSMTKGNPFQDRAARGHQALSSRLAGKA
jgi:hypothetical protein